MGDGGKSGGGNQANAAATQLSQIVGDIYGTGKPNVQLLNQQLGEALTTGGIGARIPLINAAQEASRSATSRAYQQTQNQLVQNRVAGTPFASSILAGTRMAGEQQTSLIPSQVASQFIGMGPQIALGPLSPAVSGAASAYGTSASRDIAKGAQQIGLLGSLASSGALYGGLYGSGAAAGAGAAGGAGAAKAAESIGTAALLAA